ncbi:hypothetical protein BKA15_000973 [Microlunatus parietis]|uniref:Uncharacterized protein n=1 Tax=Microlunatus parietis TaxID=682979 RepID=A0A7Y9L7C9_9ACTN|nr:hypothetical protein [Microlunatus parietis]
MRWTPCDPAEFPDSDTRPAGSGVVGSLESGRQSVTEWPQFGVPRKTIRLGDRFQGGAALSGSGPGRAQEVRRWRCMPSYALAAGSNALGSFTTEL